MMNKDIKIVEEEMKKLSDITEMGKMTHLFLGKDVNINIPEYGTDVGLRDQVIEYLTSITNNRYLKKECNIAIKLIDDIISNRSEIVNQLLNMLTLEQLIFSAEKLELNVSGKSHDHIKHLIKQNINDKNVKTIIGILDLGLIYNGTSC